LESAKHKLHLAVVNSFSSENQKQIKRKSHDKNGQGAVILLVFLSSYYEMRYCPGMQVKSVFGNSGVYPEKHGFHPGRNIMNSVNKEP